MRGNAASWWAWILFVFGIILLLVGLLLTVLVAFSSTAGLAGPNASSTIELSAIVGILLVALGIYCQRAGRRA